MGIFALRAFREEEFLFRRRHGRIIPNDEIDLLTAQEQMHLCELDFDRSAVLLPPGCYLNHSCDPNAMRSGVKVFAWRKIEAGQEITIDYRLNSFSGEECAWACGNCSGSFRLSFFDMSPDRQRDLLPYAPRFIQRKFRLLNRSRKIA
jgi:hypothetical protein